MPSLFDSLDFSGTTNYHYGEFPPKHVDTAKLIKPLARASSAIARYDQMLKGLHNSEILLAPLRSQEAVISSRIEGTISTLDEVLRYEADQEEDSDNPIIAGFRQDAVETALYARALRNAQRRLEEGAPLSSWLIRTAHRELLSLGRGASTNPGQFKTEQNYLADKSKGKILFKPISPEFLNDGMETLFHYINHSEDQILIKTAASHLEFEALHPFNDGNGRIGRMLITLMLWHHEIISAPHFYISAYLEENRNEYIDRMREVSQSHDWTNWIIFFFNGIEIQSNKNLEISEKIRSLYEEMKDRFRQKLSSQWSTAALDFLFSRPIFRNSAFTSKSGIPSATAHRFTRILVQENFLITLIPASGRRPALYAFEPLLEIVRP